jgi:RHS repeat-associated protein
LYHSTVSNQNISVERPSAGLQNNISYKGKRFYELANHLGNVRAIIRDKNLGQLPVIGRALISYNADVIKATDYYPFGMISRSVFTSSLGLNYRYGFNDKENDADVKGDGDQVDYGMRIYDPRLGRFLSIDPLQKKYPELTPYQFASNTPMQAIDLDGLEKYIVNRNFNSNGVLTSVVIQWFEDKDGNARDNETYLRNPKLKKANVYVIDHNESNNKAIHAVQYQKDLTPEQITLIRRFRDKKETPPNENHIDDRVKEGILVGNEFNDGTYKEARISLNQDIPLTFIVNSDSYTNKSIEELKLIPVAKILKNFANSKVLLTGNGGTDPGNHSNSPLGSSPLALSSMGVLNGRSVTTGQILNARAATVTRSLIDRFKIDFKRINSQAGSISPTPAGRNVNVSVRGINL